MRATLIPFTAYACPLPPAPTPTAQQATTIYAYAATQNVPHPLDITATFPTTNVVHHPTLRGLQHAATPMVP